MKGNVCLQKLVEKEEYNGISCSICAIAAFSLRLNELLQLLQHLRPVSRFISDTFHFELKHEHTSLPLHASSFLRLTACSCIQPEARNWHHCISTHCSAGDPISNQQMSTLGGRVPTAGWSCLLRPFSHFTNTWGHRSSSVVLFLDGAVQRLRKRVELSDFAGTLVEYSYNIGGTSLECCLNIARKLQEHCWKVPRNLQECQVHYSPLRRRPVQLSGRVSGKNVFCLKRSQKHGWASLNWIWTDFCSSVEFFFRCCWIDVLEVWRCDREIFEEKSISSIIHQALRSFNEETSNDK